MATPSLLKTVSPWPSTKIRILKELKCPKADKILHSHHQTSNPNYTDDVCLHGTSSISHVKKKSLSCCAFNRSPTSPATKVVCVHLDGDLVQSTISERLQPDYSGCIDEPRTLRIQIGLGRLFE